MSNKKFILNADDFGMSNAFNRAVLEGYNHGFLTSASICANGEAFSAAVNEIIPECPKLGIGIHLNIIEGISLFNNEKFNAGYLKLIYLSNSSIFMGQVEKEFRLQIERVLKYTKADHLDSHVHVHAIPNIFEITCKLAKEYGILQVRTQFEKFYLIPDVLKHINLAYPPNILKVGLLNSYTLQNRKIIKKYGLKTNDYLIGVGYTGMMDDKTVYHGLSAIKDDSIVEALIHPCFYADTKKNKDNHYKEYLITQNMDLKDKIQRLDFEIVNYKNS
ncbi:MAG: ChbG/HpnK family deacetylase [Candidatus Gastranaerophilales bacterium]|nr:ChbG/HpnK family deacetylase [Candidatus Gastranaerophilales bacterium]